jgi:hypothetical protein
MPLASAHHSARTQALARQATAIPSHLRSLHDATPWRDACIPVTAPPIGGGAAPARMHKIVQRARYLIASALSMNVHRAG